VAEWGDMHNGASPGPVWLFPMKFVKNRACGVSGYGGPVGHCDFLLATDERREMALPGAASAAACPTDSVKRHRRRHALQFVVTKLLGYEATWRWRAVRAALLIQRVLAD
jgi:hypothetical protein